MAYKGMMFSDVPNLAFAFGYTNASWTLKCDLTAEYVCRLLNHMDQHGYAQCTPRVNDPDLNEEPVTRLHLRLRAAGAAHPAATGIEDAVALTPKLREGPFDDAVRARGRRHDGVQGSAGRAQRRCGVGPAWLIAFQPLNRGRETRLDSLPLPPNRTGGSPASGSPVGGSPS